MNLGVGQSEENKATKCVCYICGICIEWMNDVCVMWGMCVCVMCICFCIDDGYISWNFSISARKMHRMSSIHSSESGYHPLMS